MLSPFYPSKLYTTKLSGSSTTTTKSIFATQSLSETLLSTTEISGGSGGTSTSTPTLDSTTVSLNAGFNAGPVIKTWTHTVTGSNPIIILTAAIFQDVAGTGSITSATWNGGSFTKASSTRTGTKATEIWYLTATTTGSKTMSVTVTGATDDIKLSASSFTNISPYSPLDTKASSNGSTGNPSVSITTLTQGDLVVSTLNRHSTTDATTSAISLYKDRTSSILGASSYQIATSPSLYTDTYTGSASQNWSMIAISLKPATSTTPTGTTTTTYIHTDHLGSTQVVTDSTGSITQTLDYYPYGEERIGTGVNKTDRHYIGERYDVQSKLNYLNARYLNSQRGGFTSQDPTFLAIGSPKLTEILTRADGLSHSSFRSGSIGARVAQEKDRRIQKEFLSDPQLLNSYSYARNNPLIYSDPNGELPFLVPILIAYGTASMTIDAWDAYNMNIKYADVTTPQQKYSSEAKFGVGVFLNLTGLTATRVGLAGYDTAISGLSATLDVMDHYFAPQIYKNANYNRIQSQNSIKSRQEFVQNYNSSMGYSTGGGGSMPSNNSLWTTPSGAVVTWGGSLVSGPPK
jgi:RHS repeat-associated protein